MRQQPPSGIDDEQGREDDWLADQGELDWFDDLHDEEASAPQHERAMPTGLVRSPRVRARVGPEIFERRRRILLLAAFAVAILIVVIVVVVATGGGGGGGSPNVAATTSQTTQPTTSSQTTTTTTTTPTTQSLHVTIPEGGNLSAGDSGSQVKTLQKALNALGHDVGTPDGDFGTKTQDAVIAFQQAHNLKPDGIVGTDTAQALNGALAAAGH
jgi:hypothetical protein